MEYLHSTLRENNSIGSPLQASLHATIRPAPFKHVRSAYRFDRDSGSTSSRSRGASHHSRRPQQQFAPATAKSPCHYAIRRRARTPAPSITECNGDRSNS